MSFSIQSMIRCPAQVTAEVFSVNLPLLILITGLPALGKTVAGFQIDITINGTVHQSIPFAYENLENLKRENRPLKILHDRRNGLIECERLPKMALEEIQGSYCALSCRIVLVIRGRLRNTRRRV